MDKKEWLESYAHYDKELDEYRQILKSERIKYAGLTDRIEKTLSDREKKRREILAAVEKVEDVQLRAILMAVFINGKSIAKAAVEFSYSEVHMRRLLEKAIEQINMPGEEESGQNKPQSASTRSGNKTNRKSKKRNTDDLKGI